VLRTLISPGGNPVTDEPSLGWMPTSPVSTVGPLLVIADPASTTKL
jgi:hypothetical protein